jgi:O-Antigen ligase
MSALFALGGAFFIFGNVYLDRSAGGADLIKIIVGLVAATAAGALMGYGRIAARAVAPLLTIHFARRCVSVIALTLLVHIPLQAAYVIAAHTLSPQTPVADLIAASAIVMFATSVPISLAGWGLRELSAVVPAAISVPQTSVRKQPRAVQPVEPVDYYRVLTWILPLGAAILVLFQVYVPVQSGLINANLADPFAILGGALFLLTAISFRRAPRWRVPYLNLAVTAATVVLTISLFVGAYRFGWTTWAVVNRFFGWFVLLSYGASASLIVHAAGKIGLRTILLTFAGAAVAVAGIELALVILKSLNFQVAADLVAVQGFALNRNLFAFQLVMAMSVILAFARGAAVRIAVLAAIMAALFFAGSRSGWITTTFVLAIAWYLRATNTREILLSIACAGILSFATALTSVGSDLPLPVIVPTVSSTQERLVSIIEGLKLFWDHPAFGAGLGAFRNQMIPTLDGRPLVIHSTAVWLLAELGVVGLLVFTVPFIYVFLKEWKYASVDQVSALIVLCFAAFAVMSGPGDMLYQRTFWFLIGAGLALRQSQSSRQICNPPDKS